MMEGRRLFSGAGGKAMLGWIGGIVEEQGVEGRCRSTAGGKIESREGREFMSGDNSGGRGVRSFSGVTASSKDSSSKGSCFTTTSSSVKSIVATRLDVTRVNSDMRNCSFCSALVAEESTAELWALTSTSSLLIIPGKE